MSRVRRRFSLSMFSVLGLDVVVFIALVLFIIFHATSPAPVPVQPRPEATVVAPPDDFGDGAQSQQSLQLQVLPGVLTLRTYPLGSNPNASTVVLKKSQQANSTTAQFSGQLNVMVVTDERSGEFGWSLSASVSRVGRSRFAGGSRVFIAPTCGEATDRQGFDYKKSGKVVVNNYREVTSAPGHFVGKPAVITGTVVLCSKDLSKSLVSQSTSGLYSVGGKITVDQPASSLPYVAVLTITLF